MRPRPAARLTLAALALAVPALALAPAAEAPGIEACASLGDLGGGCAAAGSDEGLFGCSERGLHTNQLGPHVGLRTRVCL